MRSVVAVLLLGSFGTGCSCALSHTLDGGTPPDAPTSRDGGPLDVGPPDVGPPDAPEPVDATARDAPDAIIEGRYFTLDDATGELELERCSVVRDDSAIVVVRVPLGASCRTPARVVVEVDGPHRTVTLIPQVWTEHGVPCTEIDALFVREVAVERLGAGTWTIQLGGSSASLTVAPRPSAACTGLVPIAEGGTCLATCDCEPGLACVGIRGDAVCESRCQDPCERVGSSSPELGLSCPGGRECFTDPNVGDVCRPREVDACTDDADCGEGLRCTLESPRHCAWAFDGIDTPRDPCVTNDDCVEPGFDCVHGVPGSGRCEIRCTTTDMRCPGTGLECFQVGICEYVYE